MHPAPFLKPVQALICVLFPSLIIGELGSSYNAARHYLYLLIHTTNAQAPAFCAALEGGLLFFGEEVSQRRTTRLRGSTRAIAIPRHHVPSSFGHYTLPHHPKHCTWTASFWLYTKHGIGGVYSLSRQVPNQRPPNNNKQQAKHHHGKCNDVLFSGEREPCPCFAPCFTKPWNRASLVV